MRILGPGDVVSAGTVPASMLLVDSGCRAVSTTQLAMLGKDVLVGGHRWPRLVAGLHSRTAEQIERVAVQLAICQLPRVEDRLLALFWLLAEQWGRVTPGGTVLPLALTHETLGALVGARRPTVTLALGDLSDTGRCAAPGAGVAPRRAARAARPRGPGPARAELRGGIAHDVGHPRADRHPTRRAARAPRDGRAAERAAPRAHRRGPGGARSRPRITAAQSGDPRERASRARGHADWGSIIRMSPVTTPSSSGERVMQLTLQRIAWPRRFTASSVTC